MFTDSAADLPMLPELNSLISDISINLNKLFEVLNVLQTTKASGADNIGPSVLKNCAATVKFPFLSVSKKWRSAFRVEAPHNFTSV